jgi:hypothetical protein
MKLNCQAPLWFQYWVMDLWKHAIIKFMGAVYGCESYIVPVSLCWLMCIEFLSLHAIFLLLSGDIHIMYISMPISFDS